jgi:hypothetical protein
MGGNLKTKENFNQIEQGQQSKCKINRKFRVATEIESIFFGCWSVTEQLKKLNMIFYQKYEIFNR